MHRKFFQKDVRTKTTSMTMCSITLGAILVLASQSAIQTPAFATNESIEVYSSLHDGKTADALWWSENGDMITTVVVYASDSRYRDFKSWYAPGEKAYRDSGSWAFVVIQQDKILGQECGWFGFGGYYCYYITERATEFAGLSNELAPLAFHQIGNMKQATLSTDIHGHENLSGIDQTVALDITWVANPDSQVQESPSRYHYKTPIGVFNGYHDGKYRSAIATGTIRGDYTMELGETYGFMHDEKTGATSSLNWDKYR